MYVEAADVIYLNKEASWKVLYWYKMGIILLLRMIISGLNHYFFFARGSPNRMRFKKEKVCNLW